jgi:hypothetical protein
MKDIIPPVDRELLEAELSPERFVRDTNFGGNEIYAITHHNSPNVMKEIGRLREFTFRSAGGGTGKAMDIDDYDTMEDPYVQLIVWDPDHKEILGGYRYYFCKENGKEKIDNFATNRLFEFSDEFIEEYIPHMVELGRSFVQPRFQTTGGARKILFALDNLWDGLGALVVDNPEIKYFFGKVTMYTHFNQRARDYIIYFLHKYFGDKEHLVYPKKPLKINLPITELEETFQGPSYEADYKVLSQKVRALNENIPPLINSYMNLSPTMKMFGTVLNPHFGNVEESGIMIKVADLYRTKVDRHLSSYEKK